ncbi:hypothetical protein N7492_005836 [Penicillium capsulatum]|uniref:Chromo domain-containing protein n=1 Tax=Penicillium capsulatum TaxID=69766 RepID=A0A9W9LSI7_9EURO|nr:hypothetical protein N7492_005836 [Penicillium capsulatum]KAJ6135064.1 hypothetical protein N7512_000224 [Penicillium capsulatum]
MPPPVEDVSDEENGDIPFTDAKEKATDDSQSDGDDDEEEEGVYIVERITEHNWLADGSLSLLVKWKGYEDPSDLTWEPEDGLKEGAKDVLQAYYKEIGGRPKKPAGKPGRKRKSMADDKASTSSTGPAATESKKRRKSSPKPTSKDTATPVISEDESSEESTWVPKGKNWDKEIRSVDTIMRDPDNQGLYAFLLWNNGKRSRVAIESCYDRCPRKMLKFYESHLVFKDG